MKTWLELASSLENITGTNPEVTLLKKRAVVVIPDIYIEGVMVGYLSELVEQTEVLSPDRATLQAIEEAKAKAVAYVVRAHPVDEVELDKMPKLRMISAWGVGFNHIDVVAATARRIPVCINPVFSRSIAEAALTLILGLSKRLPRLVLDARAGRKSPAPERGTEIRGKTLGIIGYGRIGREIGELGHRLDMNVVTYDPHLLSDDIPAWCRPVTLEALLETADCLVIAAPLTPETYHLIDGPQLALMKPTAYLINIARGSLVNEAALLLALQEKRIAGAGLDVWEQEPVHPDNPLLSLDTVIGTPHGLGATWESLQHVCEAIQANVLRVLAGQRPKNVVNPKVFERG
jgi:phosphoglycerate dehydrogenase-like enzyme